MTAGDLTGRDRPADPAQMALGAALHLFAKGLKVLHRVLWNTIFQDNDGRWKASSVGFWCTVMVPSLPPQPSDPISQQEMRVGAPSTPGRAGLGLIVCPAG